MKRLVFIALTLILSLSAQAYTLVIDAGHGGKDPGAIGRKSKEKNINLAVALAFGKLVEQNCPDVKVVYTRKTDVFVELDERANIANRNKADLFVSIHVNRTAAKNGPQGTETYTLGMHRAADNLEVAKRENSVITLEKRAQRDESTRESIRQDSWCFEPPACPALSSSWDTSTTPTRRLTSAALPAKALWQKASTMPSRLTRNSKTTTPGG